jgi:hypothetical protein
VTPLDAASSTLFAFVGTCTLVKSSCDNPQLLLLPRHAPAADPPVQLST